QVDAHVVEVLEPLTIFGGARAPVGLLHLIDRLGLRRREMCERNGRQIKMRLHELRGGRHRRMGMDVDGRALRPRLASGLAVLACRRRSVSVPLLHDQLPLVDQKTPRCWAIMPSWARVSAALPRNTTEPVLMMTISSARSSVSLMFCSTRTIDWPSALSCAMVRPT